MTDPTIIEAAARALYRILYPYSTSFIEEHFAWYHKAKVKDLALAEQSNVAKTFRDVPDVLATVAPLIRAAALEEAAQMAEDEDGEYWYAGEHRNMVLLQQHGCEIAAAIRALKEQP